MKLWAARNVNNTLVLFQSKPILKDELMWDAFYENFKSKIEFCKELL